MDADRRDRDLEADHPGHRLRRDDAGFDAGFTELPGYILTITKEVREHSDLTTPRRYYAPDLPMRMPGGLVTGDRAVIDGTLAALTEFPDRRLLGEDVIWSGDAGAAAGLPEMT